MVAERDSFANVALEQASSRRPRRLALVLRRIMRLQTVRTVLFWFLLAAGMATSFGQGVPLAASPPPLGIDSFAGADIPVPSALESLPRPRVSLPQMTPELSLEMLESHGPWQSAALKGYTDETLVMADLVDSSQRAALQLERSYVAPHTLTFKPISYTGDAFVKNNVITRILQSEVDYVTRDDAAQTALTVANYKFSYKGDQELDGRTVHIFQVKPRRKWAGLFKGLIYLDSSTGSLVRSQGTIVKSPSFFVRDIEFVQDYAEIGGYTLPVWLHTTARVRFLGRTVVDTFHRQYQPQPLAASLHSGNPVAIPAGPDSTPTPVIGFMGERNQHSVKPSVRTELQAAEQAVRQAQGKRLQARADLRSAETAPQQISMTRAKADAADAQARERKAQLDQADLNLIYTVVRSPVTGIIGKRTVEVGQNVSMGQELVGVVPLDDVWVTANFKETQLAHMRPGQPVEIKVDAYGRTWKAHVTNLGAGAGSVFSLLPPENATGNYVKVVQRVPVRIDFDRTSERTPERDFNAEGLLKPGLSVEPDVRVR
jgi:biotin carboxyl carrier protein